MRRLLLPALAAAALLTGCGETPVSSTDPAAPGGTPVRGAVAGTVRAADGSPARGATVLPRSLDTPARAVPEMLVVTDERGHYEWSLEPGRYGLAARPATGAGGPGLAVVVVVSSGGTAVADLTLR